MRATKRVKKPRDSERLLYEEGSFANASNWGTTVSSLCSSEWSPTEDMCVGLVEVLQVVLTCNIEAVHCLYVDLQRRYVITSTNHPP